MVLRLDDDSIHIVYAQENLSIGFQTPKLFIWTPTRVY